MHFFGCICNCNWNLKCKTQLPFCSLWLRVSAGSGWLCSHSVVFYLSSLCTHTYMCNTPVGLQLITCSLCAWLWLQTVQPGHACSHSHDAPGAVYAPAPPVCPPPPPPPPPPPALEMPKKLVIVKRSKVGSGCLSHSSMGGPLLILEADASHRGIVWYLVRSPFVCFRSVQEKEPLNFFLQLVSITVKPVITTWEMQVPWEMQIAKKC